ncbi:MAG: HAMP domain-containing histidine kinase [bacterium]|nr:HAMP domain-containing histidine kinase [bacterium]MCM1375814.1 HAMP domain-containing histidine kinase [Muribaculum sp.]
MSGRKNIFITVGFVCSVSLIVSAASVLLVSFYYSRFQFDLLNAVCGEVLERDQETRGIIAAALKEYSAGAAETKADEDILTALGYGISDFSGLSVKQNILFAAAGLLPGVFLFIAAFLYRNRQEVMRIQALTNYLEQVNTGKAIILSPAGEDDFSKLEDEIYKTVTYLYHTKETAVQARDDYAENLSNIAHQIKTPITAIFLSVQMMRQDIGGKYPEQVEKQLSRLMHLEETLLVLSRMDAGTLTLKKEEVDVYTLLVLAADNLQELFADTGSRVDIPELGEAAVIADMDWTMEAIINVLKNCMEHNAGGTVHCSYAQNPLCTEILIWDEGEGFEREDIPHLFERFYRGKNAGEGGIGIGLSLAREIIERQNGTIRARNRPDGGALFEIRFYSH